ncbi:hypothetical protein F2Q69_00019219 [Brassica cretica]|uniref:Uncharacterized protein n=1 Tax=Brassica cretica TaxID=69181 RepID=A0A8S9QS62_BRACR|nr:hypothetical protein F2Q69_00019219 [Brassica cretica]
MDAQDRVFSESIKQIHDNRDAKEEDFEMLQQQERAKVVEQHQKKNTNLSKLRRFQIQDSNEEEHLKSSQHQPDALRFLKAREMEISKSSENTFKQNQDLKTEGKVLEARRTSGGRRRSESVSDLEAEETKGFIDLGFVFTEEDLNSDVSPRRRTE